MEFLFVLIICPILVIIVTKIGARVFHNWLIVPIITFLLFTVLTFTVFNISFFLWTIVFTVLSIGVSFKTNIKA
ncbi:DUF2651 family protein [Solibacillus sp. FSL R7-0668]|uniref:DUF2651 family protein n=1 Tax=Solibacillus sp. FSL R7-0668 TaxID=2921688 RepID=UPI0030F6C89C